MQQTARQEYEVAPDLELDPELDARVREMTAVADHDLEEVRVNFRWRRQQLALIKRAAALLGIPYQTYIKHVVFRQALADLHQAEQPEVQ